MSIPVSESTCFGSDLTPQEYASFYECRKAASTMDVAQGEKFRQIVAGRQKSWSGISLQVLSIGSGAGEFDVRIIQALKESGHSIGKYVCVEPIHENITPLKANLLQVLKPEQIEITEDQFENQEFSQRFHFIHNVHVMHWMKDPVVALKKINAILDVKGVSVTVLQSDGGMPRIYKTLMPSFKGNLRGSLTAEQLSTSMHGAQIKHQVEYVDSELDVSSVVKGEATGMKILQFVLSARLAEQKFKDAVPLIQSIASEILGKHVVKEPFAFISTFQI